MENYLALARFWRERSVANCFQRRSRRSASGSNRATADGFTVAAGVRA